MEVRAVAKYVRVSPLKIKRVTDLIKDKQAEEALKILNFTRIGNARKVRKVLKSAMANAQNNFGLARDALYVKRAFAGKGPILKRIKPRARGRADMIKRRTSHITVVLEG